MKLIKRKLVEKRIQYYWFRHSLLRVYEEKVDDKLLASSV
jgi:hypothetical protein